MMRYVRYVLYSLYVALMSNFRRTEESSQVKFKNMMNVLKSDSFDRGNSKKRFRVV